MPDLKPMELGEILDGALTIFRRHFGVFAKLGIVALWLPVSLTIYIQLSGGVEQHVVLWLLAQLILYFAGLFLTAAAIRVISDSYLGRTPELGDALALGASKIWPLFLVGLGKTIILGLIGAVCGVIVAVAIPALSGASGLAALVAVLLVGAGIWFLIFVACGYAVTTPVVVLENLGGSFDAFGRSWDLTRTFKRKILGIAVVTYLIVFVPVAGVSGVGGYFALQVPVVARAIEVISAALPIVLTPIMSCVFTLMYYDLRVRREAFDLQLLGEQLGIT
ncbi:MAG TPA: hypothetical protein VGQ25_04165 [Gemmatimonadales bacterium]|jgi:hypothetical protein|nr:hypothetical protein [Gemmatimonadales bacterium]